MAELARSEHRQDDVQQNFPMKLIPELGHGARIMINHNTALNWGLLNGATGTVYDVIYEPLSRITQCDRFAKRESNI